MKKQKQKKYYNLYTNLLVQRIFAWISISALILQVVLPSSLFDFIQVEEASAATTIDITTPDTDSDWDIGVQNAISWTTTGDAPSYFKLYYSEDSGGSWDSIDDNEPYTGTPQAYLWTIPVINGPGEDDFQIKVEGYDSGDGLVDNDTTEDFNIDYGHLNRIVVTTASLAAKDVSMHFCENNTATAYDVYDNIITNIGPKIVTSLTDYGDFDESNSSLIWTNGVGVLPDHIYFNSSSGYTITVTLNDGSGNISNNEQIVVLDNVVCLSSPVSTDTWVISSPENNVTFSAGGETTVDHLDLDYSPNNGSDWYTIEDGVSVGAMPQTYNWTILADTPSSNWKVRVQSYDSGDSLIATGTSDAFTVDYGAVDSFTVVAPDSASVGKFFNLTVTALDQYSNTITNFTESTAISAVPGTITPVTIGNGSTTGTWSSGVVSYNGYQIDTADNHTITATYSSATGQDTITIHAGGGGATIGCPEGLDQIAPESEVIGILDDEANLIPMPTSISDSEVIIVAKAQDPNWNVTADGCPVGVGVDKVQLLHRQDTGEYTDLGDGIYLMPNSGTEPDFEYYKWTLEVPADTYALWYFYSMAQDYDDNAEEAPTNPSYDKVVTIDTVGSYLTATKPYDNQTDVALSTPIVLTFSQPMNRTSTQEAIEITLAGSTQLIDSGWIYRWFDQDYVLCITHRDFAYNETYQVYVDPSVAKNKNGIPMTVSDPNAVPNPFTFTTAPILVPNEPYLYNSTKNVNRYVASPGDILTYTINLRNEGGLKPTNISFVDPIPTNTTFYSFVTGGKYSARNNEITWNGRLGMGDSVEIVFQVMVDSPLANGTKITNIAYIDDGTHPVFERRAVTTVQSMPASKVVGILDADGQIVEPFPDNIYRSPLTVVAKVWDYLNVSVVNLWYRTSALDGLSWRDFGPGTKIENEKSIDDKLIQTLEVDSYSLGKSGTPIWSVPLTAGTEYKIRVEGTYTAGANITADAKYSYRDGYSTEWTDSVAGYESYGPTLLDLQIDDASPNWGVYNSNHIYWHTVIGSGDTLKFQIYDIHAPSNAGKLKVYIYEVYQPEGSDKFIQQLEVDSYSLGKSGTPIWSVPLTAGTEYKIRVEGTYTAGANITADAKYSYRDGYSTEWTDSVAGYESYGPTLLDLQIDDASPNWGVYNSNHIYWHTVIGSGDTLKFQIYDIHAPSNAGKLKVYIYEVYQPEGSDKFIQQLEVDSYSLGKSGTPIWSVPLTAGTEYKIRVEGTYTAGANITADAKYSYRDGYSTEWTDSVAGYESYGPTLLDLQIDDASPNWGVYNSNHIYWHTVIGSGDTLKFQIYDIHAPSNAGKLKVYIYEVYQPEGSDKFIQQLEVDSYSLGKSGTPIWSVPLTAGTEYKIRVEGTYTAGANITADAKYSYRDGYSTEWTDSVAGYESYGPTLLDLQIDDASPNWGVYNSNHIYWHTVIGSGDTLKFQIYDIHAPSNAGKLKVYIYEVYQPEGSDKFIQQLEVDSYSLGKSGTPIWSVPLTAGTEYKIRVEGTYTAGANITADAKYSYRDGYSTEWTDSVAGYESYGPTLLDLQIDDASPNWGVYNSNHIYWHTVIGSGDTLKFQIYDIHAPSNAGKLKVYIYEVLENQGNGSDDNTAYYTWTLDVAEQNLTYLFYSIATGMIGDIESPPVDPGYDARTVVYTIQPYISVITPSPDQKDIGLTSYIQVVFSQIMNPSAVEDAIAITLANGDSLPDKLKFQYVWYNNNKTVRLSHRTDFEYSTTYRVFIDPALAVNANGVPININNPAAQPNDWQFTTIDPRVPDISASVKGANKDEVVPGDFLLYTVVVDNTAGMKDAQVIVTDPIPDNTSYANYASGGFSYKKKDNQMYWRGDVPSGTFHELTFQVKVDNPLANSTVIDNIVTLQDQSTNPAIERITSTLVNATPDWSDSTRRVDITHNSDGSNSSMALPGDDLTYTISAVNVGSMDALDISIVDTLPEYSYLDPDSLGADGFTYNPATRTLSWTGDILQYESKIFSYKVTLDSNENYFLPPNNKAYNQTVLSDDMEGYFMENTVMVDVQGGGGENINNIHPYILETIQPEMNQSSVKLYNPIVIPFSKVMDPDTIFYEVRIGENVVNTTNWEAKWDDDTTDLTLIPDRSLEAGEIHTIQVLEGVDTDGLTLLTDGPIPNNEWNFTAVRPALYFSKPEGPITLEVNQIFGPIMIKIGDWLNFTDRETDKSREYGSYAVEKEDLVLNLETTSDSGRFGLPDLSEFFVKQWGPWYNNPSDPAKYAKIPAGQDTSNFVYTDNASGYSSMAAADLSQGYVIVDTASKPIIVSKDGQILEDQIYFATEPQAIPVNNYSNPIMFGVVNQSGDVWLEEGRMFLLSSTSPTGKFYTHDKRIIDKVVTFETNQGPVNYFSHYIQSEKLTEVIYYMDPTPGQYLLTVADGRELGFNTLGGVQIATAYSDRMAKSAGQSITLLPLKTQEYDDIIEDVIEVEDGTGRKIAYIKVTPADTTVLPAGQKTFIAKGYDTEGKEIKELIFTWYIVAGGGVITKYGLVDNNHFSQFSADSIPGVFQNTVLAIAYYNDDLMADTATVRIARTIAYGIPGFLPSTGLNTLQWLFMILALLSAVALATVEHYEKTRFAEKQDKKT